YDAVDDEQEMWRVGIRILRAVGAAATGANSRICCRSTRPGCECVPAQFAPWAVLLQVRPDPIPGIEPQRRILIVGAPVSGANGACSEGRIDSGLPRGGVLLPVKPASFPGN